MSDQRPGVSLTSTDGSSFRAVVNPNDIKFHRHLRNGSTTKALQLISSADLDLDALYPQTVKGGDPVYVPLVSSLAKALRRNEQEGFNDDDEEPRALNAIFDVLRRRGVRLFHDPETYRLADDNAQVEAVADAYTMFLRDFCPPNQEGRSVLNREKAEMLRDFGLTASILDGVFCALSNAQLWVLNDYDVVMRELERIDAATNVTESIRSTSTRPRAKL